MNVINQLGQAVKDARTQKNLSQEKLAELIDVTPTHIKHIESGRRKPSVDVLFAIAIELDLSLDALLNGSSDEFSNETDKIIHSLHKCNEKELRLIRDFIQIVLRNR